MIAGLALAVLLVLTIAIMRDRTARGDLGLQFLWIGAACLGLAPFILR
jgi:hypothetical protein